ncbi:hypothetical protein CFOL_v3_04196, partial [Cephalotus follicularis]
HHRGSPENHHCHRKSMPESRGCCPCWCRFIFSIGLTALFMWLSLRTSFPTCSIQYFYFPSLNKSLNTPKNTTLYFQLKLDNQNKDKGIYYDNINLTFVDKTNGSHLIGNTTINGFYQGYGKKAKKQGNVTTYGVDREAVFRAVSANGLAVFGVDLVTSVRFKIIFWKTGRRKMKVGGEIQVNDQGTKVNPKKGIKLKSNAHKDTCYCVVVGVLINFVVFIYLSRRSFPCVFYF